MNKIEEGDHVVVTITEDFMIEGTVLYTPCQTGDAFHIQEDLTYRVWYIQNYLCMFREKRND